MLFVYAEITPFWWQLCCKNILYFIFNFCSVLSAGLLSFFIPCYQLGKNAEAIGQNCIICGIVSLFGIIGVVVHIYLRGKIREEKGISVSFGQSHNKSILHRKCCRVCLYTLQLNKLRSSQTNCNLLCIVYCYTFVIYSVTV